MNRIFSRGMLLVFLLLALAILITWLIRISLSSREILASVSATEVELGTPLFYSDSTYKTYGDSN